MRTTAILLTTLQVILFAVCLCIGVSALYQRPDALGLTVAALPLGLATLVLMTLTVTFAVHAAAAKITSTMRGGS